MNEFNEKEKFLKEFEGRKDLLYMLSLDRLKMLNSYYDEDIRKKKEKIKDLKSQLQ